MRLKAPHYCYDWDGLYISPWHVEYNACTCRFASPYHWFMSWVWWVVHWWRQDLTWKRGY